MDIRRDSRHRKASNKGIGGLLVSCGVLAAVIYIFWSSVKEYDPSAYQATDTSSTIEYIPQTVLGEMYQKPFFTISYVEQFEIPEWVAYKLTVGMLNQPKTPRTQDFEIDHSISGGSAHYHDYKNSGYRRGHLVPSADMSWNKEAMDATFLLSNIAPMRESFNDGIWLELEHNVRDWARKHEEIFVIAGPVTSDSITAIGKNDVLVPRYYYKAVFSYGQDDKPLVIGFLFDQTLDPVAPLQDFIVPVDSIEKVTGLDLFAGMYGSWDQEITDEGKKEFNPFQWSFNEKWYRERMNELN
jgi:endonuclease G